MKIKLAKGLEEISNLEKQRSSGLGTDTKEYPISLEVSSDVDGLYYVKLHVVIPGKGMRAFAVPVNFGEGKLKTENATVEKTQKGEKISVTTAQETITRE